jgi:hypothetical protein
MRSDARLTLLGKVRLLLRVWASFLTVQIQRRRHPLPELVRRLAAERRPLPYHLPPVRVGRIVVRSLSVGPLGPRCLTNALVHFRVLRLQGEPVELVIGLPDAASDKGAHAWIELAGRDVGPPPGRGDHEELVRYPREPSR